MEADADQGAFRNQGAKALPVQALNDGGVPAKSERHGRI